MSKILTNIKERILYFAENQEDSKSIFFRKTGLSYNNFTGPAKNSDIKSGALVNILTSYTNINLQWLLTGEGEMLKSNKSSVDLLKEEDDILYKVENKGVPYYDVEFTAGFTFLEMSQTNTPSSYIAHPFFSTSDFVVRNSGQSMAKVIKHGDAIGLKHLPNWQEFLAFGEIYAIVLTDDRRLVKIITKGDNEDNYTLISKPSDNKKDEFPPQQIKKSLIRNVFRVEAASCLF